MAGSAASGSKVGGRVRSLRQQLGWTLERTAEQLGMAVQNYARIEKGQNLTLETLLRLARLFGVQAHELLQEHPAEAWLAPLARAGWRRVSPADSLELSALPVLDLAMMAACWPRTNGLEVLAWLVPPGQRPDFGAEGRFLAQLPDGAWALCVAPVVPPLLGRTLVLPAAAIEPTAPRHCVARVGALQVAGEAGITVRLDPMQAASPPVWISVAAEAKAPAVAEVIEMLTPSPTIRR